MQRHRERGARTNAAARALAVAVAGHTFPLSCLLLLDPLVELEHGRLL